MSFKSLLDEIGLLDELPNHESKDKLDPDLFKIVDEYLDIFIGYNKKITDLEKRVQKLRGVSGKSKKKNVIGRRPNFPEFISENIIKIFFYYKYGKILTTPLGNIDLVMQLRDKQLRIEVKAFSSTGPTSFGDKEEWDLLYFVDCMNFSEKRFKIYEIRVGDDSVGFGSLPVPGYRWWSHLRAETLATKKYHRPRWTFDVIHKHLPASTHMVFDGRLCDLHTLGNKVGDKTDDRDADGISR